MSRAAEVSAVKEKLNEPLARFERKNAQYAAGDQSVFENFIAAGQLLGMDPKTVCVVYMTKHICRLSQIATGRGTPPGPGEVEELGGDVQTYTGILRAMHELGIGSEMKDGLSELREMIQRARFERDEGRPFQALELLEDYLERAAA